MRGLPVPPDQRPGPLPVRDGFGNIRLPVKGGAEVAITLGDAQRVAQRQHIHGADAVVESYFDAEHAKVLASVSAVREALREDQEGNAAWCRELAQALQDWFPGHVQHLDSALATWLVHRTHGGRPLVLRRKTACTNRL